MYHYLVLLRVSPHTLKNVCSAGLETKHCFCRNKCVFIFFTQVNMERLYLPLKLGPGKVNIFISGKQLILETDFGLKVAFDWNTLLLLTLPRNLYNASCGLCQGMPLSPPTLTTTDWGMAWAERDTFCHVGCGDSCQRCGLGEKSVLNDAPLMVANANMNMGTDNGTNDVNTGIRFHMGDGLYVFMEPEAVRLCRLIEDRGGAFARCHSKVAPAFFYQGCLQDTCMDQGAKDTICNWLQIYASTCQTQGVPVTGWRSDTPCGESGLNLKRIIHKFSHCMTGKYIYLQWYLPMWIVLVLYALVF